MKLSFLRRASVAFLASATFAELAREVQGQVVDAYDRFIKDVQLKQPTHKSTTTPEKYFHFNEDDIAEVWEEGFSHYPHHATVFCRTDDSGRWFMSTALCHPVDSFSRAKGRAVARRKWFDGKSSIINQFGDASVEPSFEQVKVRLRDMLK